MLMQADKSLNEYVVHDLLSQIRGITSRAMFGGYGIYKNGKIFAIIADGELYFKVGDSNKADYQKHDSKPFVYDAHGKQMEMSYWQLPQEIMDNKDKVAIWVEKSWPSRKRVRKGRKVVRVEIYQFHRIGKFENSVRIGMNETGAGFW